MKLREPLAVILAALLTVGCGLLPGPTPPEPPPPCTPGSCDRNPNDPRACNTESGNCEPCVPDLSGAIWNTDAGEVWCSTAERPVKHWPPADECPRLTQPCEEIELPTPQCATLPPGSCACFAGEVWQPCVPPQEGCVNEADLVVASCSEIYSAQVKTATTALGDRCGEFWLDNLSALAEQLRTQLPEACILAGKEAVFIQRPDGRYEENHAVFSANGCWTGNGYGKYKGCHVDTSGPTEPPSGRCVNPDPGDYPDALFTLVKHNNAWDSTYKKQSRQYCDEVAENQDCEAFRGRHRCPVRCEGDPNREVCERQEIGVQKWWCDGRELEKCGATRNPDCILSNPAQARCRGTVKTCTEDLATCQEADW